MIATPTLQSASRAPVSFLSTDSAVPAGGAEAASFGTMLLRSTPLDAGATTAPAQAFGAIPGQTVHSATALQSPLPAEHAAPTAAVAGQVGPIAANPTAYRFAANLVSSAKPEPLAATGIAPPTPGNIVPLPGIVTQTLFAKPAANTATPARREAGKAASLTADDAQSVEPGAVVLPDAASLQLATPAFVIGSAMSPLPSSSPTTDPAPFPAPVAASPAHSPEPGVIGAALPALANIPVVRTSATPTAAPVIPTQAPIPAADRASPIAQAELVRFATDGPLPSDPVTVRVALPQAAAVADPSRMPAPMLRQVAQLTSARTPGEIPSQPERQPATPGDLSPVLTAIPAAAPFAQPAPSHQADPQMPTIPNAVAPDRVDFAALVDGIARAREQAAPQAAPVAVSLAHADFGPVALRFHHEGDALAVTMASADPGFAPAVAAATAAEAGARAGQQQQADAQPRHQQPGSTPQQSLASPSGSANQDFAQSGQNLAGQGQPDQRQTSQNRSGGPVPTPRAGSRSGDSGESDPDIFA